MSFIFNKPRQPVAKSVKVPTLNRQNAATLNRLGCSACPLNKAPINSPKMGPTLAPHTEVLFLAEAPGRHEDESSGKPLTGPSGHLVRGCIPKGQEGGCSFDNICNCRPEGNRTPVWQEIEACRPRRIKVIEQAKPKLIVGLGAIPLGFMLGSGDMVGMRGRLFAVKVGKHECYFLPTYHPAFILRLAQNKSKPLQSRLGNCFSQDIKRAFAALPHLPPVHIDSEAEVRAGIQCFNGNDIQGLLALLSKARAAPIKAVDLETSHLKPYVEGAKLLSAAISFGDTNFSFAIEHPQARWCNYEFLEIICEFSDLLLDDTIKIAHNAPFDLEWLAWFFERGVINHTAWEDTMLQAHFLDERKGDRREDDNSGANRYLSLDFLSKQHFGVAYKSLFKLPKKHMADADIDELLLYNAVDTKYTLRLYYRQKQLLSQFGMGAAYMEAAPRQPTVALMQGIGIPVDQAEARRQEARLSTEIKGFEAKIDSLEIVQEFKAKRRVFNPASGPDVVAIFKDYLKRPEILVKDKHGKERVSVDRHVLERIDHPLANLIVQLRNRAKMKSTYIDGVILGSGNMIFPDGRLHTTYHTTGTETGRLSSSSVNLQNYPKRNDVEIRRTVVAPEGHLILAVDYKQLEGSCTAMCSRDSYYVKALSENYDTHMEWSRKLAAKVPEAPKGFKDFDKFRSMIKNKLVFPAFYGASNESVCAYLSDGCNMTIPQDKVDEIMTEFWQAFSGVKAWQDRLMKRYYDVGYVETLSGRRRHYPLSRNEAINMPIQGTAAELVCDAMVRMSHLAATTGQWHLHPVLNIHDDISYLVPDDDAVLEKAIRIITKEMLTFSFPWVNVPLACDVAVGPNWCDLQSVGTYWSNT